MILRVAALLVATLVVLPSAEAAPDELRAKRFFSAGSLAYERGRYIDAVRAFEAAYLAYPNPSIAFSLAQAHRRLYFVDADRARLDRAISLYRLYLEGDAKKNRAGEAADQIQALESIRARTAATNEPAPVAAEEVRTEVMIYSAAPDARARVDGGSSRELPAIVEVSAGAHRVEVDAPGFVSATVQIEAVENRLTPIPVELEDEPGRVTVRTRAGAEVYVDGELRGTAPVGVLAVPAGPHRLAVLEGGTGGFARRFEVERAQQLDLEAALVTTNQRRVATYTLIGAGVLLAAAGTTAALAASAESTASDIAGNRGVTNIQLEDLDRYNDAVGRRDGLRTATYAIATTAVVAAIIGGVLYLFDGVELEDVESRL